MLMFFDLFGKQIIIFLVIAVIVLMWDEIVNFLRMFQKPLHVDSSILLTYYTDKAKIIPLSGGVIGRRYSYSSMFLKTRTNTLSKTSAYTAYFVHLPFTSRVRLLAIPTKNYIPLNPALTNSMMDAVLLEGDFHNYFKLYANDDQQTQSRYVLDPKAMAFVIDFCKEYNWELINNQLIVITSELIDHTLLIKFIDEIRPAVELKPEYLQRPVNPDYYTPFGFKAIVDRRKSKKLLLCPLCKARTVYSNKKYYSCPNKHGHIMTAQELMNLPNNNNLISENTITHTIKCPNCKKEMTKVNYGGGKVIIDTCLQCPYRWVDEGELIPDNSKNK